MDRNQMADLVVARLETDAKALREAYLQSGRIKYFAIDNLLPEEVALQIRAAFPKGETMKIKRSLREIKFIAAQMNEYDPILKSV